MKYVINFFYGEKFKVNGKTYVKTNEESNIVEAYDIQENRFTCFWAWTKATPI